MRRVLAPLGGAISFAAVALLVLGGLTWVTVESLHVENERRMATARADASQQERLALWQLDSRLFPAWGVENSRAYAHYFTYYTPYPVVLDNFAANNNELPKATSPILCGDFPEWMKLHFQLDPETGWTSPQVMSDDGAAKLRGLVEDMFAQSPYSVNGKRSEALKELQDRFPKKLCHEQLMGLEKMNPEDSPLAVPYLPEAPRPAVLPPVMTPPPVTGAAMATGGSRGEGGAAPDPVNPSQKKMEEPPVAPRGMPAPGAAAAPTPVEPQTPPAPAAMDGNARGGARGANPPQVAGQPPGYATRAVVSKNGQEDARNAAANNVTIAPVSMPTVEAAKADVSGRDLKKEADRPKAAEVAPMLPPAGPGGKWIADEKKPAEAAPPALAVFGGFFLNNDKQDAKAKLAQVKPPTVQVGPMRPVWLKGENGEEALVLVRAARLENKTVFQGVLLDWPRLKAMLLGEILPQLPQAKLEAVRDAAPNERLMTALPAALDPGPEPVPPPAGWTPLRIGLTLGWVAALLALAAAGFVGWTLMDLSERRIRFVSAVTHELRTPLTALRLYTDLLVSGMISDEEKQKEYLRTLGHESERLNTLIENVLDFAKLEKRTVQACCTPMAVTDLLEQAKCTWAERLANEGREFVVMSTLPPEQLVTTDARIASQILGNLIDNARKYSQHAEEKRIWLWARPGEQGRIVFEVEDRGPGVAASESGTIFKPFRRGQNVSATGGAGLGLALAKQWTDLLGGTLTYRAVEGGTGACFRLELPR